MERRLKLAQRLLNSENSVLIVTIDEKEVHRLGLLLEQSFPEARIQMVSDTVNPKGTSRPRMFSRVDEFIFFVLIGAAFVPDVPEEEGAGKPVRWRYLRREDDESMRGTRPRQFYPVFVDPIVPRVVGVGDPIPPDIPVASISSPEGLVAVFPIREDGVEMEWGLTGPSLMRNVEGGFVRATSGHQNQPFIISYLTAPNIKKVNNGDLEVVGERVDGSKIVVSPTAKASRPRTVWRQTRHSAGDYGTKMLGSLIPGRRFPFPKSLYSVEDAIRLFVRDKPDAVVLDFFAGSGTTTHAVFRLNRQDGGRRRSIAVTNNEVSADERAVLTGKGLRPGDAEWEALGICEYVTKPRLTAAVTGRTPDGQLIEGEYKFTDGFPMADGFEENVEFFTMTYEAPLPVAHNRSFRAIAPLLWMRSGSQGRRVEAVTGDYDVAETYGVLFNLDCSHRFVDAVAKSETVKMVFIVTDDERAYQMVYSELPPGVEAVRLYESYVTNFAINAGRE
jgi:adenine-specific DNA-methyltransferase